MLKILDESKLHFQEEGHIYTYENEIIPSVSTILNLCAIKDSLHNWLNKNRGTSEHDLAKEKADTANNLGTHIHNSIEDFMNEIGNRYVSQDDITKASLLPIKTAKDIQTMVSINNALKFYKENNVLPMENEGKTVCDYNGMKYAGTYDFSGKKNEEDIIVDYKTNQKTESLFRIYKVPGYERQIATYVKSTNASHGYIYHTTLNMSYEVKKEDIESMFDDFIVLLDLHYNKPKEKEIIKLWNTGDTHEEISEKTSEEINNIQKIINKYTLW